MIDLINSDRLRLFLFKDRQPVDDRNLKSLKHAIAKLEQRILDELQRTDFFTGTLTISVQNGTIRTGKVGIEECEHFGTK